MTTSIFIRSYRADRFWLEYCLRSLQKFASGFAEIIVALPLGDEPHFDQYDFRGAKVVWVNDPNECSGYCAQQLSKLNADCYCVGETILFLDSDCFVTGDMRPEMFLRGGRPIQLLRHWGDLPKNAQDWRPITRGIVGFEPQFEYMALHPLIFDRRTFALTRAMIEHTQKKPMSEFVSGIVANRMSEFNALGAVAHRCHPSFYHFEMADPNTDGYPRMVKQQWSYKEGGVENHKEEYERILAA